MKIAVVLFAGLLFCRAGLADEPPPRIAVVVGANGAPPGRRPLLFSHRDAETMAEVLASVGGFRKEDVLLLEDPTPAALMTAVDAAVARLSDRPHGVLYFYYSGHADETALYPGGQALPMARLRRIIDEAHVATKIGLVDACRGGGWTRSKGLVPDAPFAVHWPMTLDSEGSVLIASSSGQESAHESDHLQGSFFTVHFAAGLRGAADSNGNKEVTLTEAFEYAKDLTIRDTVRLARETQHPSYAVNLRGRRDLVLAQIDASPTTVHVDESEGPLQIIHEASGLEMVDIPAGKREIRIALPPGRYLVRKTTAAGNLIQEITVTAGVRNHIDERELVLIGNDRLAAKAPPPRAGMMLEESAPSPSAGSGYRIAGWTALGVAALAAAAGIKFGLDVKSVGKSLDVYRRFSCPSSASPSGLCTANLQPAQPLTAAEERYVGEKKYDAQRLQGMETVSFVASGVAAVTAGLLFWKGYLGSTESRSAFRLLPLADAGGRLRAGLALAVQM
jgi:hypothetical protein